MFEKKFIAPHAPLPKISAKWFVDLFAERLSQIPVSFGKILVLVPTRASAKNLRQAIFNECVERGVNGICELTIKTLEDELADYDNPQNTISATETRATWISILNEIDLDSLTALFPFAVPSRSDYFHFAKELEFLQNTLAENLESILSASEKLRDSPDSQRWQDLKNLEAIFDDKTRKIQKLTRLQSLKNAISQSVESGKWKYVVVVGNPDVSTVLKEYLTQLDAHKIKVYIGIISEKEDAFDAFGAPIAQKYSDSELQISDSDIHIFSDVKKQAQTVANLAETYADKVYDVLAISCEQQNSIDIFKDEFAKKSINAISLEAESLENTEIFDLIKNLHSYCELPTFKNFLNLIRNPIALKKLESITQINADDILADLDFIAQESLCADVKQANSALYARLNSQDFNSDKSRTRLLQIKYLREIFAFAERCIAIKENPAEIPNFISELLPDNLSDNEKLAESVMRECIENTSKAENLTKTKFTSKEFFTILINYISTASVKIELEDKRLPLQDWMEIFWSNKPHLLLCDMNDGIVPLANSDGIFLNDSIRKKLGMRHQLLRQARDAYMLETLYYSRKNRGGITICVPKHNINEDPLMPSRILFQAHDLPHRTQLLFQEPNKQEIQTRYTPEWNLNIPKLKYTGGYNVTRLNTYLDSPFQFYLQYVLSMSEINPQIDEMDALQFGNLFHKTLYKFAVSNIKDSADAKKISECLLDEFVTIEHDTFGNSPRAQVRMQLENLKNRILACAKIQAEHRIQGWEIEYAEKPFKTKLCDRDFTGVFDRVDINEKNGSRLILDYKTYDKYQPNITKEKHIAIKGGEVQWQSLQLPLYVYAGNEMFKSDDIQCGYFVAPKNISDTCIDIWYNANDFKQSALEKAQEIISKIEAGIFEPSDDSRHNNYQSVFRISNDLLGEVLKFQE